MVAKPLCRASIQAAACGASGTRRGRRTVVRAARPPHSGAGGAFSRTPTGGAGGEGAPAFPPHGGAEIQRRRPAHRSSASSTISRSTTVCPTGTAPEERWASSSTRLAEAYTAGLEENKVLLAALRLWARRCSMRSTRSRHGGPRAPSDACRVRTAHNFWPAQLAETADAYYDPAEESNSAFSAEADPDAEQAENWVTESAEEAYYAEEQLAALLSTAAENNAGETGNGEKENLTAAYVYVAEATTTAASLSVSGSDGKSGPSTGAARPIPAARQAGGWDTGAVMSSTRSTARARRRACCRSS